MYKDLQTINLPITFLEFLMSGIGCLMHKDLQMIHFIFSRIFKVKKVYQTNIRKSYNGHGDWAIVNTIQTELSSPQTTFSTTIVQSSVANKHLKKKPQSSLGNTLVVCPISNNK